MRHGEVSDFGERVERKRGVEENGIRRKSDEQNRLMI